MTTQTQITIEGRLFVIRLNGGRWEVAHKGGLISTHMTRNAAIAYVAQIN